MITEKMLQELPQKGIVMITYLFNAALRLRYIPWQWKQAKVGKPPVDPNSHRPISLLPILSKSFEKLYAQRLQEEMQYCSSKPGLVHDFSIY